MNSHFVAEPEFLRLGTSRRSCQLDHPRTTIVRAGYKQQPISGAPHRSADIHSGPRWKEIFPDRLAGVWIITVNAISRCNNQLFFAIERYDQRRGWRNIRKVDGAPYCAAVIQTKSHHPTLPRSDRSYYQFFVGNWTRGITGLHRPSHLVGQCVVFLDETVRPEKLACDPIEGEELFVGRSSKQPVADKQRSRV